ncbi:MAG: adenylate/guanylate cyclase domain-containing protein [Magnetococcales bacterium]|nr:adenylate/guanylate cyclase domain-containing protein [Magnetococcales bacterium]
MATIRSIISAFIVFLLAIAFSWVGMEKLSVLGMMERWISDVRIATLTPPEPQHPDIIVVTITEETLRRFPYRSPIDRNFLSKLLKDLEEKQVRAVLLDMLLDQPTEIEKDNMLRKTIAEYKIPLAISYVNSKNLLTNSQQEYLDNFIGNENKGLANLGKDPFDNTVRQLYPGRVLDDGSFMPSITARLAMKLGVTPPKESIEIAWRGAPLDSEENEPFRVFPAQMVTFLPPAWFKDKIILIGSDLSLRDRHRTPFSVNARNSTGLSKFGMPGVFVLAHTFSQLLDNRDSPNPRPFYNLLILSACALFGTFLAWVPIRLLIRLIMVIISVPIFWSGGFYLFKSGGALIPLIMPTLGFISAFMFSEIYRGWEDRKKRAFLKQAFSRYLSPELVDLLVKDPDRLTRGAERRELTFLFTDIEGFTTVSEKSDPNELAPQMNIYLDGVCSTILRHGGMVVDLIGDAVFAMFNAPLDQKDHANRALLCALEVNKVAKEFQKTPEAIRLGFGRTRIGINTGEALVGNFGAEDRFKYTPLGDAVNTGARIEGLNKYFKTEICASGRSVSSGNVDSVRLIGDVVLKGKKEPITIFEVIPEDMHEENEYLERYKKAFELLEKEDKSAAKTAFAALAKEKPDDGCVAFHLKRLENNQGGRLITMTDK